MSAARKPGCSTSRKLEAFCTEAEYDQLYERAWEKRQTIEEYLRSLLGLAPDGWVERRRMLPPTRHRGRTKFVVTCTEEEWRVVFKSAHPRTMSEHVRVLLGWASDAWVQPGRRKH